MLKNNLIFSIPNSSQGKQMHCNHDWKFSPLTMLNTNISDSPKNAKKRFRDFLFYAKNWPGLSLICIPFRNINLSHLQLKNIY